MSAAPAGMLAAIRNDATAAKNFLIVAPARERSRSAITATPSIATRRTKAIRKQRQESDCRSLVSAAQRQYSVALNWNWTKDCSAATEAWERCHPGRIARLNVQSGRRPRADGPRSIIRHRRGSMVSVATRTHRIRHDTRVILFTMCLGVFIAQLDSQVVNLAIKQIGSDLGAGISQLQWVMDSYNLLYATLLLTGGTLGDLYGRVRIFAAGIGLIVLGSIVCAIAPTGAVLIAGRGLTGIGAALEVPTSLAILTVTYGDAKARAHAVGIWARCARRAPA